MYLFLLLEVPVKSLHLFITTAHICVCIYAKAVVKNCMAEMRRDIKLEVWHREAGLKVLVSLNIVFIKTVRDMYGD